MVNMPAEVRATVAGQRILPIATADPTGTPNVILVAIWKILDDETILIVDNYLNKTKRNLEANPRMAVVVYNRDTRKSFQLKGSVTIETTGPRFAEAQTLANAGNFPGRAAVVLTVTDIYEAQSGPNAGKRIA
jgi:predicted pyridoxine 5'-phosphate oxidase superfamily flavin-nucleotide-binding protein